MDPSDLSVIVPDPNFCVWPVTVFPSRPRSVVIVPEPNGLVSVVVPSDQRVIVPEPNFCVCPVIVRPSFVRSVVIEPEPKGRVWLLVPSDLFVIVPDPNLSVVPERGWLIVDLGGVGSAAKTVLTHAATSMTRGVGSQGLVADRMAWGSRRKRKAWRGASMSPPGIAVYEPPAKRGGDFPGISPASAV